MLDVLFAAIIATSAPAPQSPIDVYPAEVGNGVISEDESGWSCVGMGNRICGPGNSNGVPAGRYDEGGVLVDVWPAISTSR